MPRLVAQFWLEFWVLLQPLTSTPVAASSTRSLLQEKVEPPAEEPPGDSSLSPGVVVWVLVAIIAVVVVGVGACIAIFIRPRCQSEPVSNIDGSNEGHIPKPMGYPQTRPAILPK